MTADLDAIRADLTAWDTARSHGPNLYDHLLLDELSLRFARHLRALLDQHDADAQRIAGLDRANDAAQQHIAVLLARIAALETALAELIAAAIHAAPYNPALQGKAFVAKMTLKGENHD